MPDLREELEKALVRYNELRAPEAVAELVELAGDIAVIRFTGSFCRTCGVYDYFEDLLGYIPGEILGFEGTEGGFFVRYRLGGAAAPRAVEEGQGPG